ncbi:hypothetical protein M406DRAFT_65608 [Cryphonectria parasitica EP155]|uniref:ATP-grasp domain-containing protein n=1 Tax=Cryphonectria parasitica (strain ATCC 38755 / EP155) TaxID=660469 RepID=A0A9P4Y9J7_CRYP1|nr:uncharacterized protein M406DRAFT_65608 [Cryphonectria parasitica EP155]KAF3769318.1 hypothetical protein M406DRAFT_65608 [Cryphonectria parasitica EP155]
MRMGVCLVTSKTGFHDYNDRQKSQTNKTPWAGHTIRLDTTLADLYRENGIQGPFIVTMYCVFGHMDLHPAFPRELVYPEDEEPVPYSNDENERSRLRRIILGLKPLRRAFGLGNMDVVFFAPNITEAGMHKALSQLPPDQRHHPRIINLDDGSNPFGKLKEASEGRKLLFWRPQGWMDDHDCLLDPREMFDVNSKKFLVTSGIRTPRSESMDLRSVHLDQPSCSLRTRPLPFVVKLCRAGCGFGTFIVKTEAQREEMVASMVVYKARGTTEILVSQYIDLVRDLSVHFVVGAPGTRHDRNNPLIMGVTVQTLTTNGKWVGGHIDYSRQEELKRLVWDTVRDTTQRLPESFMGWAGVDIVADREGKQWVVDLNARFTGSMPICLMSGHFWKERGLPLAQFAAVEYGGSVDDIYNRLQPLIETGQVIVTATAEIGSDDNMADVVWGGKDAVNLEEIQGWIRARLAQA